jgi:hypothetical protein
LTSSEQQAAISDSGVEQQAAITNSGVAIDVE